MNILNSIKGAIGLKTKPATFNVIYESQAQMDVLRVNKTSVCPHNDLKSLGQNESGTIRNCPSFMLSRSVGFVVYNPFAFDVIVGSDGSCGIEVFRQEFANRISVHDKGQHQHFYKNYVAVQVETDICIREKTGVKCLYTAPITENCEMSNDIAVPTGVLDFKQNNAMNLFFMMRIPEIGERRYSVKMGAPSAKVIPLCREYAIGHSVDPLFKTVNSYVGNGSKQKYLQAKKSIARGDKAIREGR